MYLCRGNRVQRQKKFFFLSWPRALLMWQDGLRPPRGWPMDGRAGSEVGRCAHCHENPSVRKDGPSVPSTGSLHHICSLRLVWGGRTDVQVWAPGTPTGASQGKSQGRKEDMWAELRPFPPPLPLHFHQLPSCLAVRAPRLPVTHSDVQMPSGRQGPPDMPRGSRPFLGAPL